MNLKQTKQMTKKFKTLPKIQTLQLIRNANRILLNKLHSNVLNNNNESKDAETLSMELNLMYNNYEASEIALSQYLNK